MSAASAVPAVPAMRPVLRPGLRMHRDPSGRAALVDGDCIYWLDTVTATLLERLDGLRDETSVLAEHRGEESATAWRRLRDGAVVVDVEAPVRPLRDLAEPVDPDPLAETTTLVAHDPSTAPVRWRRRRTATVAVLGQSVVTAAVAALLAQAGIGRVQRGAASTEPDVTVLTHDHEPGTDTAEHLMRAGRPHVVAGMRGTSGVVGPFVRPGTTSCLRCVDLSRTAEQPGWAVLRDQVSHPAAVAGTAAQPASCVTTTTVAALVVADVLAQLDGRDPATLGSTLSMSLHRPLPEVRSWPIQPACGCAWHAEVAARGQWTA